ncbi:MAG: porin family protein [bacterium]|nr:porin family protein [bacterium]
MTTNKTLGIAVFLITVSTTASFPAEIPHRWYAGGSYGASSLHHGVEDLSDGSIRDATVDNSDTGWKLFGGRRLGRHLSIELGYVDLNNDVDGETTLFVSSDGSGTRLSEGPVSIDLDEPHAAVAAIVGTLPLTRRAIFLAKAGATAWKADLTTINQFGNSTRSESGTDATLGIGLQYRAANRTEIRVEWERYFDVAGDDIDLASLGVLVGLGG